MKIKLFLVSVLVLILAGCATRAKYQDILNSWIGASEQSLIESWGVPEGVYNVGDLKFLTYKYSNQRVLYGAPPIYVNNVYNGVFYPQPIGGTPDMVVSDWCKTTFTIQNEIVIKWSIHGNSCVAN